MTGLKILLISALLMGCWTTSGQNSKARFHVIAFHDGEHDKAHASFVKEADKWFSGIASDNYFIYRSTTDWSVLNTDSLAGYDVVIFLDSRPESEEQRTAFQQYMESGGAWMGFHFAAFALTPSDFPQNWDWYHNEFLGSGQYRSNTWRPTPALLHAENRKHPATCNLPEKFVSSANEWYRWEKDLRKNPDIDILVSIDTASFPLGTGPKPYEIWHDGYYPVVWTNKKYRMIYFNMGHNDLDYENRTDRELSSTFGNKIQDKLILDGLLWLGNR